MSLERLTAKASPTKEFFVRMLTRDISLEDCLLDLIDNSVDAAWHRAGITSGTLESDDLLSDFLIDITLSADAFTIRDNCGGMTLDDAADYAFNFGRRPERGTNDFSVGVYGIGMKRAVFKLGNQIVVRSTPFEATGTGTPFKVEIDVPAWLQTDAGAWDFDISEDTPLPQPGVEITVADLLHETSDQFSTTEFARRLRRVIARDYMIPLMRGFRIAVNGILVKPWRVALVDSDEFTPMRHRYHDAGVDVEIIAGVLASEADDDDQSEDSKHRPSTLSGWYVICNRRVVLAADTSQATGWADLLPRWHAQYNGFVGFAFFTAANPNLLPMTTTKRDVDLSSALYRRTLTLRMAPPTKQWISYTNDAKKQELQQRVPDDVGLVDLAEARNSDRLLLPQVVRTNAKVANVNYAVPLRRMRALANSWDGPGMTFREVGLRSFDYTYSQFVDEG